VKGYVIDANTSRESGEGTHRIPSWPNGLIISIVIIIIIIIIIISWRIFPHPSADPTRPFGIFAQFRPIRLAQKIRRFFI
jgi:hypothetical protein